jgi:RNA polymerase sigma factor (sigma-70 family)
MQKLNFFYEKEILKRIRSNDRTILGELFLRYKKPIFDYIQSHGGNIKDAEDMLQEAIIVFWQNAIKAEFKLTSKVSTYLIAVAKNKWMAETRKQKRISKNTIPENLKDNNPSSLDRLLEEENLESIKKALNLISPNCKKLLLLFYFEGRNLVEIAKILHLANANVAKAKKYQCKKSLEDVFVKKFSEFERRVQ